MRPRRDRQHASGLCVTITRSRMQGTHEKPDPHLLTLHIIVLIIGSRAVTTLATPFRRVAEAHHARRSCEASLETPPLFHLRIHRRRGKIHRRASGRRADRLRGRALVARAPRGEGPEVRFRCKGKTSCSRRRAARCSRSPTKTSRRRRSETLFRVSMVPRASCASAGRARVRGDGREVERGCERKS